jgi:hypothetical protein
MMRYSIEQLNATGASTLDRALGSASQRQVLENKFQAFVTTWTRVITPNLLNRLSFAENSFFNNTTPVAPQIDLPSLQEGASFRVPQQTKQNRLEFGDIVDLSHREAQLQVRCGSAACGVELLSRRFSASTYRSRGKTFPTSIGTAMGRSPGMTCSSP